MRNTDNLLAKYKTRIARDFITETDKGLIKTYLEAFATDLRVLEEDMSDMICARDCYIKELREKVSGYERVIRNKMKSKPKLTQTDLREYHNKLMREEISFSRFKELIETHFGKYKKEGE